MTAAPPLVALVGSEADGMLSAVHASCRRRGVEARRQHPREFALSISIGVDGPSADVAPRCAAMIRPEFEGAEGAEDADLDADFMRSERRTQLEAFAALSPLPVVNRPARADVFRGPVVATAGLRPEAAGRFAGRVPSERFVSELDPDGAGWEFQDLSSFRTGRLSEHPQPDRPYRLRKARSEAAPYVTVVVVGDRAWSIDDYLGASTAIQLDSIDLARELGLDFCCVTWQGSLARDDLTIARVDPYPSYWRLGALGRTVADAVAGLLET